MRYFKPILSIKVILAVTFLCFNQQSFAQRRNLIFESTFESANSISQWYERSLFKPWSATIENTQIRAGKGALKVELIRGSDVLNGPRAELGMAPQTSNEFWYGFSNFFPTSYVRDPVEEIISQWQAMPDTKLGEEWRSPPLSLQIKDDRYKVSVIWSSANISTSENTHIDFFDLGPVDRNRWNDWVFHVKWSYNSGTLQIWKNGVLLLERLNKPIGYNDVLYPYFKIGIYKWEWSNPKTISTSTNRMYYIDEIRIGNNLATYKDVLPGDAEVTNQALPIVPNTLKVIKGAEGSYSVSFTASETITQSSKFILYISSNNGKDYTPILSDSTLNLEKNKTYTLTFKAK